MRTPGRLLVPVAALLVGVAAGCGSADTPTPRAAPSSIGPAVTPSAAAQLTFGPPPSPTPDEAAPVVLDPTLLGLLPEAVAGFPVTEDLDAASLALADPALDTIATALESAVAVDAGNGDLVLATIVRLRPGAFGDELYRQWRDSFDDGACAAAGGVVGHAEADIGGRKTYVTSCVQGMHTYHLWLEDQGVLLSASSIGDGRFGEELLKGLRL